MDDRRIRVSAGNPTLPLLLLSLFVVSGCGGAETDEAAADSADSAAVGPAAPAAQAVTEEDLRTGPQRFEGQAVRVTLPVAGPVGTQAFFLDVKDAPFLVKIGEALAAQGQGIPQGEVTVTGPLLLMTDSIRQDWMAKGIVPAADEILVEFATHFIDARSITGGAAAPAADTPAAAPRP